MTKCQDKNLDILETKRAFKMQQKAFFFIFKGLSLKQIKRNFFGRWEPDFTAHWLTEDKVIRDGLEMFAKYFPKFPKKSSI